MIVVVGSLIFILNNGCEVYKSTKIDNREKTEAIIVLGAAQFDGKPSPVFSARLDHAVELINEGVAPVVITVGGNQPGDRFTEAESGKNYLQKYIKSEKIGSIPIGTNTYESLEAVKKNFPELNVITLVTDPCHLYRSQVIAEEFDFEVNLSGTIEGPGSKVTPDYLFKEAVAVNIYYFSKVNNLINKFYTR